MEAGSRQRQAVSAMAARLSITANLSPTFSARPLAAGNRSVVPHDFIEYRAHHLEYETRLHAILFSQPGDPRHLRCLTHRIEWRQVVRPLVEADLLRDPKTLGQQQDEFGVDGVQALAQVVQVGLHLPCTSVIQLRARLTNVMALNDWRQEPMSGKSHQANLARM
jgi:hypothetical protein